MKTRAAKVRDLFNLLKFEEDGVVFLIQTKRKIMAELGRKMKALTPEWRSAQVRGNLVGLTNTKTGKFETFGYTGLGAKGSVELAPFLAGENKYLCSVPPKNEVLRAICKEFEDKRESEEVHVVGGFVHKRVLREYKGPASATEAESEALLPAGEGSDFLALTPRQVLSLSQQQTRGQMALTLFGLPYYMSFLRPLHYTALDLKGKGDGESGGEQPGQAKAAESSDTQV